MDNHLGIIKNIVICSTFNHYKQLRVMLKLYFTNLHSYTVTLGEDVTFSSHVKLKKNLINMVKGADLAVVIIGPVYGSKPYGEEISYTHEELIEAVEKIEEDKPFFRVYADKKIESIYTSMNYNNLKEIEKKKSYSDELKKFIEDQMEKTDSDCTFTELIRMLQMFDIIKKNDYVWKPNDANIIFNDLDAFLLDNTITVIKNNTLITESNYKEYTIHPSKKNNKFPYLPRDGDIEYELNNDLKKINSNLKSSIRELFLIGHGKQPNALEDFCNSYREAISTFVNNLTDTIEGISDTEETIMYFTDPAINVGKDVWTKNEYFLDILGTTCQISDDLLKNNTKIQFIRIFIFDESIDLVNRGTDIAFIILIQLAIGVNIGIQKKNKLINRKKYKNIFKPTNLNFYLLDNKILGFLDIEFPYIRMHSVFEKDISYENENEKKLKLLFGKEIIKQFSEEMKLFCYNQRRSFFWQNRSSDSLCYGKSKITQAIDVLRKLKISEQLNETIKGVGLDSLLDKLINNKKVIDGIEEIKQIIIARIK